MGATVKDRVIEVARLLEEHLAEDILAIDIARMNVWTDYFVIATVRSQAHLQGLLRWLYEYFGQADIQPLNRHKGTTERGWVLIDCGDFVVHLMEKEQRGFYELEKLWFNSELVYHSSRSS
jgi:ribosome-associated protein